jgi:hypothetical protein
MVGGVFRVADRIPCDGRLWDGPSIDLELATTVAMVRNSTFGC